MAVNLSPLAGAGAQFFTDDGVPLAGGLLYIYGAGTTTPLTTYTSSAGVTTNANPIVLDAAGRVPEEIWLPNGYAAKFVLKTSTDVLIWTKDNIPGSAQPAIVNDASSVTYDYGGNITAGSFVIGQTYKITFIGSTNFLAIGAVSNTVGTYFIATGVGSGTGKADLIRSVQNRLRDSASVKDFGAIGDGVADDSAAIQAAVNACKSVYFPAGDYYLASTVTLPVSDMTLYGDGRVSRIFGSVSPLIQSNTTTVAREQNFDGLMFEATGDNTSLQLHRTWTASGASFSYISNCFFYNSSTTTTTAKCISLRGLTGLIISDNNFVGRGAGGGPTDGIGGYGIYTSFDSAMTSAVMNINVQGNTFFTLAYPYWIEDRVITSGGRAEGHHIRGNTFVSGHTVFRSSQSLATLFIGNMVSAFYRGVVLNGDFSWNISSNYIDGSDVGISLNGVSGGFCERGVIASNEFLLPLTSGTTVSYGIKLDNSTGFVSRVRDCVITGNHIGLSAVANPYAKCIGFTGTDTVVGMTITGNELSYAGIGIDFDNSSGVNFININSNSFRFCTTGISYTNTSATNTFVYVASSMFSGTTNKVVNPTYSGTLIDKTYATTSVITVGAGGTSANLDVTIPANTFSAAPATAFASSDGSAELFNSYYQGFSGSTTATNARFTIARNDGGAIVGGNVRFYYTMTGTGYYVG